MLRLDRPSAHAKGDPLLSRRSMRHVRRPSARLLASVCVALVFIGIFSLHGIAPAKAPPQRGLRSSSSMSFGVTRDARLLHRPNNYQNLQKYAKKSLAGLSRDLRVYGENDPVDAVMPETEESLKRKKADKNAIPDDWNDGLTAEERAKTPAMRDRYIFDEGFKFQRLIMEGKDGGNASLSRPTRLDPDDTWLADEFGPDNPREIARQILVGNRYKGLEKPGDSMDKNPFKALELDGNNRDPTKLGVRDFYYGFLGFVGAPGAVQQAIKRKKEKKKEDKERAEKEAEWDFNDLLRRGWTRKKEPPIWRYRGIDPDTGGPYRKQDMQAKPRTHYFDPYDLKVESVTRGWKLGMDSYRKNENDITLEGKERLIIYERMLRDERNFEVQEPLTGRVMTYRSAIPMVKATKELEGGARPNPIWTERFNGRLIAMTPVDVVEPEEPREFKKDPDVWNFTGYQEIAPKKTILRGGEVAGLEDGEPVPPLFGTEFDFVTLAVDEEAARKWFVLEGHKSIPQDFDAHLVAGYDPEKMKEAFNEDEEETDDEVSFNELVNEEKGAVKKFVDWFFPEWPERFTVKGLQESIPQKKGVEVSAFSDYDLAMMNALIYGPFSKQIRIKFGAPRGLERWREKFASQEYHLADMTQEEKDKLGSEAKRFEKWMESLDAEINSSYEWHGAELVINFDQHHRAWIQYQPSFDRRRRPMVDPMGAFQGADPTEFNSEKFILGALGEEEDLESPFGHLRSILVGASKALFLKPDPLHGIRKEIAQIEAELDHTKSNAFMVQELTPEKMAEERREKMELDSLFPQPFEKNAKIATMHITKDQEWRQTEEERTGESDRTRSQSYTDPWLQPDPCPYEEYENLLRFRVKNKGVARESSYRPPAPAMRKYKKPVYKIEEDSAASAKGGFKKGVFPKMYVRQKISTKQRFTMRKVAEFGPLRSFANMEKMDLGDDTDFMNGLFAPSNVHHMDAELVGTIFGRDPYTDYSGDEHFVEMIKPYKPEEPAKDETALAPASQQPPQQPMLPAANDPVSMVMNAMQKATQPVPDNMAAGGGPAGLFDDAPPKAPAFMNVQMQKTTTYYQQRPAPPGLGFETDMMMGGQAAPSQPLSGPPGLFDEAPTLSSPPGLFDDDDDDATTVTASSSLSSPSSPSSPPPPGLFDDDDAEKNGEDVSML